MSKFNNLLNRTARHTSMAIKKLASIPNDTATAVPRVHEKSTLCDKLGAPKLYRRPLNVKLRIQPLNPLPNGLWVQFRVAATKARLTNEPPSCKGPLTFKYSFGPIGGLRLKHDGRLQLSTFISMLWKNTRTLIFYIHQHSLIMIKFAQVNITRTVLVHMISMRWDSPSDILICFCSILSVPEP